MQGNLLFGNTFNCVKTGLTGISGAATTYTTSATALSYCIRGKAYTKAQVSGGATPVVGGISGLAITLVANFGRAVLWAINAAGTVFVFEGPTVALDGSGNFVDTPQFPVIDLETYCPIAYTLHKAGATTVGTWTFGSSNWNATGMVHVVQDLLSMPDRPQAL